MFDRISDACRQTLSLAKQEALQAGLGRIDLVHFLLALLREPTPAVVEVLRRIGVSSTQLVLILAELMPHGAPPQAALRPLPFTRDARRALTLAFTLTPAVFGTAHLLFGAVAAAQDPVRAALHAKGLEPEALRAVLAGLPDEESYVLKWPKGAAGLDSSSPKHTAHDLPFAIAGVEEMQRFPYWLTNIGDVRHHAPAISILNLLLRHCSIALDELRACVDGDDSSPTSPQP